ncbi:MAG: ChbG/HpnK family deacetylase [Lachnospiraceae bacterium]|nr:ChbG/HpnK family deacetylase [Lachnospiraceae bacterium]
MILYNADDYGINPSQAKRILYCAKNGVLNGISIFVNSPEIENCLKLIKNKDIQVRLHLNFREGHCLAEPKDIPLLVDEKGFFKLSFVDMLKLSIIKEKDLESQLKIECACQLKRMEELMGDGYRLRIDSHQHYHIIPAVWRALISSSRDLGLEIEEIRIPVEPFMPFITHPNSWRYISFSGIVKSLLLHTLHYWNSVFGPKIDNLKMKAPLFFGMIFTTRMYCGAVSGLLPAFKALAQKQGRDLELMFHPGGVYKGELYLDDKDYSFYRSPDRKKEAYTLCRLSSS